MATNEHENAIVSGMRASKDRSYHGIITLLSLAKTTPCIFMSLVFSSQPWTRRVSCLLIPRTSNRDPNVHTNLCNEGTIA